MTPRFQLSKPDLGKLLERFTQLSHFIGKYSANISQQIELVGKFSHSVDPNDREVGQEYSWSTKFDGSSGQKNGPIFSETYPEPWGAGF